MTTYQQPLQQTAVNSGEKMSVVEEITFELILIFLVLLSMLVIIFASFSQGFIQNPPTLDEVP